MCQIVCSVNCCRVICCALELVCVVVLLFKFLLVLDECCVCVIFEWDFGFRYDFIACPIIHPRHKRELFFGKAKDRPGPFTRPDLLLSGKGSVD